MARDEHVSIRCGFVAMICVLFLYIFLMLGGATINVFNPDIVAVGDRLYLGGQERAPGVARRDRGHRESWPRVSPRLRLSWP